MNQVPLNIQAPTINSSTNPISDPIIHSNQLPQLNTDDSIPIRGTASIIAAITNTDTQVLDHGGDDGNTPPIINDNNPADPPSSSSSSSSSTSSDSSQHTVYEIYTSIPGGSNGSPPPNNGNDGRSTSTNGTKRRTASKILSEIAKNAGRIEFTTLIYHADPERRKLQFIKFSQNLQYCSALTMELESCFRDLNRVTRSPYPNANQALHTFILSRVDNNFYNILNQLAHEDETYRNNGYGAYKHIFKICLPNDVEDRNTTLTNFMNISMNANEHMSQFVTRYNRMHDLLQRSGIRRSTGDIIDHFLQKVNHIRISQLQVYISMIRNQRREEQKTNIETELSLMVIQRELCRDYDLEIQQHRRTQTSLTTMPPARSSRVNMVHRPHQQQSRPRTHNNNTTGTTSQITCYGCNRKGHTLKECRSTPQHKKRDIYNRLNGNNNTRIRDSTRLSNPSPIVANAVTTTNDNNSSNGNINHSTTNTNNIPIIRSDRTSTQHRSTANSVRRAYINMVSAQLSNNAVTNDFTIHETPHFNGDITNRLPSRPVIYNQEIILDSGASDHMCNSLDVLYNIHHTYVDVQLPDGSISPCNRAGNMLVIVECRESHQKHLIELTDVLYVPGFTHCLWSVNAFTQNGHSVEFGDDAVRLTLFRGLAFEFNIILHRPFQQLSRQRIFANAVRRERKQKINIELMHKRLGHCAMKTLLAASNDDLYNDVTINHEPTGFCSGCQIGSIRTAQRGDQPVGTTTRSGLVWFLDIIKNPAQEGLTRQSYSPYYLNMVDSYSRYQILHPIDSPTTANVITTLHLLESIHRPRDHFTVNDIQTIHADSGTQFTSITFNRWCIIHGINLRLAAPEHQEQNGVCEAAWGHLRAITFRILSEARLAHRFCDVAFTYAWQIKNVLPLRGLLTPISPLGDPDLLRTCTPYERYFDKKPNVSRFHVFGCPCIVKVTHRRTNDTDATPENLTTQNIIQRGVRGIFVGFPINQSGYKIFIPSSGHFLISLDVAFDEYFSSSNAYPFSIFHDAQATRVSHTGRTTIGPYAHTGPPNVYMDTADINAPWTPYTAINPEIPYSPQALPPDAHIDEYQIEEEANDDSDEDLFGDDVSYTPPPTETNIPTNSQDNPTTTPTSTSPSNNIATNTEPPPSETNDTDNTHHNDDDDIIFILADSDDEIIQSNDSYDNDHDDAHEISDQEQNNSNASDNVVSFHEDTKFQEEEFKASHSTIKYRDCDRRSKPSPPLRRSKRSIKHSYDHDNYVYTMYNKVLNKPFSAYLAQALNAMKQSNISNDDARIITSDVIQASNPYTNINDIGIEGSDPVYFLPEPRTLSEVIKMPVAIRKAWLKAFVDEFSGLISKGTVRVITENEAKTLTKTTPVMDIYKCKLDQNGLIEKLKCRIVFRGDLYQPSIPEDSWNPFASYMALRVFLALCAKFKMPIASADWVQAYLQCDMSPDEEVYIQFPAYWSEFLPKHLGVYCGRPLRLLKALYGYTYSGKRLYENQEAFMEAQGFIQSTLLGLWYKHLPNNGIFLVLIFADDQLIATTDQQELVQYKTNLQKHFEIQWHTHANWFLKARINQDQYGDITIDQNRYSKSIVQKYIPNSQYPPSEKDINKYRNPIPNNFIWKKSDCSKDIKEVQLLEQQFQFRFIEVVGSLIFLANTAVRQLFAIRKLCKFMHLPGRRHFEALSHMLNHLRCHPARALKYYHDITKSPLYHHITKALPNEHHINPTLIYFTDSAFQDCEDKRSTGCYIGFLQGGIIDMASTVPLPIASSTAEAETSFASITYLNSLQVARAYMEIVNRSPDETYTVPILTDSSATIAIAANQRGTSNTKHMSRRQLLVRQGQNLGYIKLYHVQGKTDQIADIGTKSGIPTAEFEYKMAICETMDFPDNIPSHN